MAAGGSERRRRKSADDLVFVRGSPCETRNDFGIAAAVALDHLLGARRSRALRDAGDPAGCSAGSQFELGELPCWLEAWCSSGRERRGGSLLASWLVMREGMESMSGSMSMSTRSSSPRRLWLALGGW